MPLSRLVKNWLLVVLGAQLTDQPSKEMSLESASSDQESDGADNLLLNESQRRNQKQSPGSSHTKILCVLLFSSTAVIFLLAFQLLQHPGALYVAGTGNEHGDCGNSAEEARANGCRFDIMSFVWQRPACYYEDLIESFKARSDWHFYSNWTLDPADELPLDRVLAGDYDFVYAPKKFHPIHCTYMWQKMHTAYQEGLPLDDATPPMGHTLHCEKVLLIDYTGEASCKDYSGCPTSLRAAFTECGYVRRAAKA